MGPKELCMFESLLELSDSASFITKTPMMTSEWPHKYFVAEWIT